MQIVFTAYVFILKNEFLIFFKYLNPLGCNT